MQTGQPTKRGSWLPRGLMRPVLGTPAAFWCVAGVSGALGGLAYQHVRVPNPLLGTSGSILSGLVSAIGNPIQGLLMGLAFGAPAWFLLRRFPRVRWGWLPLTMGAFAVSLLLAPFAGIWLVARLADLSLAGGPSLLREGIQLALLLATVLTGGAGGLLVGMVQAVLLPARHRTWLLTSMIGGGLFAFGRQLPGTLLNFLLDAGTDPSAIGWSPPVVLLNLLAAPSMLGLAYTVAGCVLLAVWFRADPDPATELPSVRTRAVLGALGLGLAGAIGVRLVANGLRFISPP
jgi:hypothetical protein